jgi:signal transduction histidine kinase
LRSEHADKWSADANKVEAKVNAVAKQVARYCEWAELITAALLEAEAVNREVDRVNGCAPDGINRRIDKVELAQFKTLVLPDPQHPNRNLWPAPKPSIAEIYAQGMAAPAHPGAAWASDEWQRRRAEAARAEQQRQAEYYANLTRQQEERQNREERERFAQSRAGRA